MHCLGHDVGEIVTVRADEVRHRAHYPHINLVLQRGVVKNATPKVLERARKSLPQFTVLIFEHLDKRCTRRVPNALSEGAYAGAIEELVLKVFKLLLNVGLLLQVAAEIAQECADRLPCWVSRIMCHGADEAHRFRMEAPINEAFDHRWHPGG